MKMTSYIGQHFETIETNKIFVFSPAINMKKNGDYQLTLLICGDILLLGVLFVNHVQITEIASLQHKNCLGLCRFRDDHLIHGGERKQSLDHG